MSIKTTTLYGHLHSAIYRLTHPFYLYHSGSIDKISESQLFHSQIISDFIKKHNIQTINIIGCGYGVEIKSIRRIFQDITIYGFDIDDRCISYCKNKFDHDPKIKIIKLNIGSEAMYVSDNLSAAICFETMYFLSPNEIEYFLKNISKSGIQYFLFETHNNSFRYGERYNTELETKSRYSGDQGAWDHPYIFLLKKYFTILDIKSMSSNIRSKSGQNQDSWVFELQFRET